MNDYSKVIIEQMDDLAVRSLPPELFEKWAEIATHYADRPVTKETHKLIRERVYPNNNFTVPISSEENLPNIQYYFDENKNLIFCCCV